MSTKSLTTKIFAMMCGATLGLVLIALMVLSYRLIFPETLVNKETTVQQIACVNGGYLSFVATDVYFSNFAHGVVTFKDQQGVLVVYKMGPHEYCGWNPAVTKDKLVGLAPETVDDQ